MSYITLKNGRTVHVGTNFELAKFLLFSAPKLKDHEKVEGELPHLRIDDSVSKLLRVSAKVRANKIKHDEELIKNSEVPF